MGREACPDDRLDRALMLRGLAHPATHLLRRLHTSLTCKACKFALLTKTPIEDAEDKDQTVAFIGQFDPLA
jgi:hypothetical protein